MFAVILPISREYAIARPGSGAQMDFHEAVAAHSQWKRKLREGLTKHDGSLRPVEVALDHKCALGQWIYGAGSSYSALPEFTKLKYDHARFHQVAADLVSKANRGESIEHDLAPCSNTEFSNASSGVIIAIRQMMKRLVS